VPYKYLVVGLIHVLAGEKHVIAGFKLVIAGTRYVITVMDICDGATYIETCGLIDRLE
jgi:hypothetical protein